MLRHPIGALLGVLVCLLPAVRVPAALYQVIAGGGLPIQSVIAAAAPGDTLLLKGSFSGAGNVNLDPAGKNLVYLSDMGSPASLSGGGQTLFRFQSGETAATVLAGLTFTGATTAIICSGSAAPRLRDCIFTENYGNAASGTGGAGLRCEGGAAPRLERCRFENNAHLRGGAVCALGDAAPVFIDCVFSGNTAAWGGAVFSALASPSFDGVEFTSNSAYPLPDGSGEPVGGDGGACFATYGAPTFTRCLWQSNQTHGLDGSPSEGGHGGALRAEGQAQLLIESSTFYDNAAERAGGALSLDGAALATLSECLLALNLPDGLHGAGGAALAISCSDVWGDGAPGYAGTLADATGSDGNLAVDPVLCGAVGGSSPLGLHSSSPCLPGGNACAVQMGRYGQACMGNIHVHEVPLEYATIQAAIDVATPGDTVRVAPGTYSGTGNRNLNTGGKDLVIVGTAGPALTIIDCQAAAPGIVYATGETAAAKLSGFTIQNGRHTTGAGILCIGSAPTLENLVLTANHALTDGGGLACIGASPTVIDLVIHHNTSADDGAGLLCAGGAAPSFLNCQLYDNSAPNRGGALYCLAAFPQFVGSVLAFNSADGGGGAIWADQASLVTLTRSLAVFSLEGGGLEAAGGAGFAASCSDVFGNAGGDWRGSAVDLSGQDGNLSADPLFCAPLVRDFHLDADSPCAAANNACGDDIGPLGVGCDNVHRRITGRITEPGGSPLVGAGVYGSYYEAHTDAAGDYAILVPDHWTGIILPLAAGYTFTPPYRNFVNVVADIAGQDFLARRGTLHRVPSDYADIQSGLDAAVSGDTVLVAAGTYRGARNKRLDFGGHDIVLRSEAGPAVTIIDCELAGRAINFEQGEGPAAIVDGFTIRRGHVWYEWESNNGGGIRVSNASPTLRNLIIEDCRAKGAGGGLVLGGSSSQLENLVLRRNEAYGEVYGRGGALACFGGAPALGDLLAHDNRAAEAGGAVYFSGGAPRLAQATLSDNEAARGGAIGLAYAAAVQLENLLVTFNAAPAGGALHAEDAPSLASWSCSDIFGNGSEPFAGYAEAPGGDCFAEDPLYCGVMGADYMVADASPCLPENNDCAALVGVYAVGCTLTETPPAAPGGFYLAPNHPNPFNPATTLRFGLPAPARVTLRILDVQGREVARPLAAASLPAGEHRLRWEARDAHGAPLPSGAYFCRLEAGGLSASRTLLLIK